jgi:hypothetical protein
VDRAAKGKGLGALAILAFGKGKPGASKPPSHAEPDLTEPDADEDDVDVSGGEHAAAFDAFAEAAGIPPEQRGAAESALKQYVEACMRDYGPKTEG